MPSWFDLKAIPVAHGQAHAGFDDAVAKVHSLIANAMSKGIPPHRIVVGGFSQGGALSLQAGLSHASKLGGICCLSGWWAFASRPIIHRSTSIFMGHGTEDDVVPFAAGKGSFELARRAGCTSLHFKEYRGLPHSAAPEELDDLAAFLRRVLPAEVKVAPPAPALPRATQASPQYRSSCSRGMCRVEVDMTTPKGTTLDVSAQALRLGGAVQLLAPWPSPVRVAQASATFLRPRQVLVVRAPMQ